MDAFKLWILSVCGASAITSLCRLLVSKSKLKKTTNIFFSLFVLLYMLLPFMNSDDKLFNSYNMQSEISFDFNYRDGYEKLVEESINNFIKENIETEDRTEFDDGTVEVDNYEEIDEPERPEIIKEEL